MNWYERLLWTVGLAVASFVADEIVEAIGRSEAQDEWEAMYMDYGGEA